MSNNQSHICMVDALEEGLVYIGGAFLEGND